MTIRWLWTIHQSCLIPIEAQRTCQPRRHSGSGSDDRSPGALNLSKSVSDTSSASRILTFLYIYWWMPRYRRVPFESSWHGLSSPAPSWNQDPLEQCVLFRVWRCCTSICTRRCRTGVSTAAAFKNPTLKRMVMVEKNCCGLYDMDQKSIRQKNMDKLGEHPNMVYRCLLSEYLLKFHQGTLSN